MNGTTCEGKCTGTCTGGCSGTCSATPPSVACEGSCKGECSVAFEAPSCEGEVTPPSCDIDAECQGGCDAQGSLKAECTPPKITIVGDATLAATLEKWLPEIWLLFTVQGELILDAALYVGETAIDVAGEFTASLGCVAAFGAEFVGKFSAAAEASVSVSVSVEASAEVGGTAGG